LSDQDQNAHEMRVRFLYTDRLGFSSDLEQAAERWQHMLQTQLSSTLLPCPDSRTELVATWLSPAGGPRHAFRFLGGVVLPTSETVLELAHNLRELAYGRPLLPHCLLRPEPLHFEQVVGVLEQLGKQGRAPAAQGEGEVRPDPSMTGRAERHEVHLTRAVTAVLVETHETLHVWGTRANGVPMKAGERLAWVDGEASIEGLRELQRVIGAAIERRAGGDS
jgi:hypothetical protein